MHRCTPADGLGNYFSDNATPPGQTFTTGSNPAGYTLTAIQLKTAGVNSSATGTAKTYTLRLYSISGSTATLISTYLSDNTVGFTDGDWLRYTGMTNVLQPNTVYAYSHRQNGAGWDQISAVLGDTYTGGQGVSDSAGRWRDCLQHKRSVGRRVSGEHGAQWISGHSKRHHCDGKFAGGGNALTVWMCQHR